MGEQSENICHRKKAQICSNRGLHCTQLRRSTPIGTIFHVGLCEGVLQQSRGKTCPDVKLKHSEHNTNINPI